MKEKIYFLCPQKHCFKDTNKPVHWVGHSKLRSLDKDYFFKRTPQFYENQASVTRKNKKRKMQLKILQMIMIKMQKIMKELIKIRKN